MVLAVVASFSMRSRMSRGTAAKSGSTSGASALPKWRSQTAQALARRRSASAACASEQATGHENPSAPTHQPSRSARMRALASRFASTTWQSASAKSSGERRRSFQMPYRAEPRAVNDGSFTGVNQRGAR